ncbi:hypothetical protein ACFVWY_18620 [Streptomyces sp. NPDC058195]|uniref:hypothetical protein n=1 Tax=Streptomyces sp. NPDC058195 TaxID=3346375 RepID=UPI0036E94AFB
MRSVSKAVLRDVAAAGAAVALVLAVPVVTAGTAAATPPGLSCDTGKHAVDEYTGFALCSNGGSAPQTFWVHLVCGWAPDVDGEHITLAPGQSGQSTAHCGDIGTGIGEISVQP